MAEDVTSELQPGLNPLACSDTGLRPNMLLAAKLTILVLLVDGFWFQTAHFANLVLLPLQAAGVVAATVHAFTAALALAILLNRFVQPATLMLGATILVQQAASNAGIQPHVFLCGSLLFLTGLQDRGENLVRWQVVVAHFALFLEASRQNGWIAGWKIEPWVPEDFSNPVVLLANSLLPAGWFVTAAAWTLVAVELALVAGFLTRRFIKPAIWLGLIVHLSLYAAIGTNATAAFVLALFCGYLSFLDWPRRTISALWPRSCGWPLWLRIALDRYDFDHRIDWPLPPDPNAELEVKWNGHHRRNGRAIRDLLLYFPVFYFTVFGVIGINLLVWPIGIAVTANSALGLCLIGFFAFADFRGFRFGRRRRLRTRPVAT